MATLIENNEFNENRVLIRRYRTSDYEATAEILNHLNELYHIGLKKKQWNKSSGLRQFKPNLKRETLVAELKSTGEVICMGVIEATKNNLSQYVGYLNTWATKKEFVGMKVGKILADQAVQILRSWGCELIRIELGYGVPEKMIKVFGSTGFKPVMIILEKKFEK